MQWKIQPKEAEEEVGESAPWVEVLKKKQRGEKKIGENTP